jgi:hypothetical protein
MLEGGAPPGRVGAGGVTSTAGQPARPPAPGAPPPPFQSRLVYERAGRIERLTGKIIRVGGEWVFRRDLAPANLLRALDAFAIDLVLLERLERDLVDAVHYRYEGRLYAVSTARLRDKGIAWDRGGRAQLALPRRYWSVINDYPQERIPESRRETIELP